VECSDFSCIFFSSDRCYWPKAETTTSNSVAKGRITIVCVISEKTSEMKW
jgi:hypothetical protein